MTLRIDQLKTGDALPDVVNTPDNVQLFFYNAALWNGHRIHFDLPYATEVEGYPGLVIAGPMIGDWMSQCVVDWLGDDGRLRRFSYSNRRAAYIGDTLTARGRVSEVDRHDALVHLNLEVVNGDGEVVAPGTATVWLER